MDRDTTILLVEDDEDTRAVYRTMLEHVGFGVLETSNGEEAVDLAVAHVPDVVFMDISIPGIDGWTAMERLRADDRTRDIPVVAVTAHAYHQNRDRAERVACAGYLTKPCGPRRLLEEIRRLLP